MKDAIKCIATGVRIGLSVSKLIEGSDVPIGGYCVNYSVETKDEAWPGHTLRDQQSIKASVLVTGYVEGEFLHSYADKRYDFDRYNRAYEPYRARFHRIGIDVFMDDNSLTPIKTYETDMVALRRFFTGKVLTYFNILSLIEQELGGFSGILPRLNNKQQINQLQIV